MQPIIGIVADDLTGGMETAAMLVALGVDCGFVTRPALVRHFANSPAVVVAQKTRVVPAAELVSTALAAGKTIAALSPLSVMMAKELVGAAFETPLSQGVKLERRLFHSLFAFEDQAEGMAAFVEKRKPAFKSR